MNRICVFAGSQPGSDPIFQEAAEKLGQSLAQAGIGVVYGGGKVGLMGVLADAALAFGGEVIGVIPRALMERELGHAQITELHQVESMHQRKHLMHTLSDAFVALPGGFGTLEELIETLTWGQLGMHRKPCALLNVGGFYDALLTFLDHAEEKRLLQAHHRTLLLVEKEVDALIERVRRYRPPRITQVIGRGET